MKPDRRAEEWEARHWLSIAAFALLICAPFLMAVRLEAGCAALGVAVVFIVVAVGMAPDDDGN